MSEQESQVDATGLPIDPAARSAEIDRLIAAGEAEMKRDIKGWQSDQQRRADHTVLLEERERSQDSGPDGMGFYATADVDELRQVQDRLEPVIAEMESLMRTNIRAYHDKENAPARALYNRCLEIRSKLNERLK